MPKLKLSRRAFLRGMLGGAAVTVGLPPLEAMFNANGNALAVGGPLPRRFGVWFWGNGVLPDLWNPKGEGRGDSWQLSEQLRPLAPLKHKISVVSGTKVGIFNDVPHIAGPAGLLSGRPLIDASDDDYTFQGPTLDQIVARELSGQARFDSLELAVKAPPHRSVSYNGPNSFNPMETSPRKAFERIFGAGFRQPGDEPIIDPTLSLRRSVLDAVAADARKLRGKLGAADQARLDQHLDGVRALELRIARLEEDPPDLAACQKPAAPPETIADVEGRPQLAEIAAAHDEVLAMALACDQTRVFTYMFSYSVSNILFPGSEAGHHQLTHDEPNPQAQVNDIVIFIMERFSKLLQRLDGVDEGEGTLLDSCAILGTTDCSFGRTHSIEDYPIVVAGSACGSLKTDVHYRSFSGESSGKVSLSLLRAMGLRLNEFGLDGGRVTEGLGAIEA